jgi:hypothetical protein
VLVVLIQVLLMVELVAILYLGLLVLQAEVLEEKPAHQHQATPEVLAVAVEIIRLVGRGAVPYRAKVIMAVLVIQVAHLMVEVEVAVLEQLV